MGEMQHEGAVEAEGQVIEAQGEQPGERVWAGNFKSPEELERAYSELRSMESRRNEELAQLRKIAEKVEQLEEQVTAPVRQRESQAIEQSIIEALDSDDPYERMRAQAWITQEVVKAQLAEFQTPKQSIDPSIAADIADRRMAAKYQDWNAVKGDVAAVIQERPHLFPIGENASVDDIVNSLDVVYEVARARHVLRNGSQAANDAAAAARAAKEAAQTMQGTSSRPETQTPEQAAWDRIKNAKVGLFS